MVGLRPRCAPPPTLPLLPVPPQRFGRDGLGGDSYILFGCFLYNVVMLIRKKMDLYYIITSKEIATSFVLYTDKITKYVTKGLILEKNNRKRKQCRDGSQSLIFMLFYDQ